jgi:hypothetical protein
MERLDPEMRNLTAELAQANTNAEKESIELRMKVRF